MENENITFEKALEQLEEVVQALEKEEVPLEKAIDLYQKGMKLSKLCDDKLRHAENKMVQVLNEEQQVEPFEIQED